MRELKPRSDPSKSSVKVRRRVHLTASSRGRDSCLTGGVNFFLLHRISWFVGGLSVSVPLIPLAFFILVASINSRSARGRTFATADGWRVLMGRAALADGWRMCLQVRRWGGRERTQHSQICDACALDALSWLSLPALRLRGDTDLAERKQVA